MLTRHDLLVVRDGVGKLGLPIEATSPSGKEVVQCYMSVQASEVVQPDANRRVAIKAATFLVYEGSFS